MLKEQFLELQQDVANFRESTAGTFVSAESLEAYNALLRKLYAYLLVACPDKILLEMEAVKLLDLPFAGSSIEYFTKMMQAQNSGKLKLVFVGIEGNPTGSS